MGNASTISTRAKRNLASLKIVDQSSGMDTLLVFTNLPDRAAAEQLAQILIERRLAACVNLMAPCRSVYHWQGVTETAEEVPVLIKTTAARYASLQQAIVDMHPYELPEIIAVPVTHGLPAYLSWVADNTGVPAASKVAGAA
jgi:periplasmic divalent cation tolerance protein